MYRISFFALVLAFLAELGVDIMSQAILVNLLSGDGIADDMSTDAARQAFEAVTQSPAFTTWSLILGTATTVGGGYLAARLARQYPYYHGLGMGLLGIAFTLFLWREQPLWLGLFAILSNIPLCIWGAHLAKKHMPPPPG
jgi:hypothetical protein